MGDHIFQIERGCNHASVVFVHGILGDFRTTWGRFPELVTQDTPLNHCDVATWGYPARLVDAFPWIPFRRKRLPDLETVSRALMTDLKYTDRFAKYSSLVLVGHSMGGLVVLQAVLSAIESNDNAFLDRINHVVLFATPGDGMHIPDLLKLLQPQSAQIDCSSEFFTKLLSGWSQRVHTTRPGDRPEPGKRHILVTGVRGEVDNIVPNGREWGYLWSDLCRDGKPLVATGDHEGISKPSNKEHESFQILRRAILEGGPDGHVGRIDTVMADAGLVDLQMRDNVSKRHLPPGEFVRAAKHELVITGLCCLRVFEQQLEAFTTAVRQDRGVYIMLLAPWSTEVSHWSIREGIDISAAQDRVFEIIRGAGLTSHVRVFETMPPFTAVGIDLGMGKPLESEPRLRVQPSSVCQPQSRGLILEFKRTIGHGPLEFFAADLRRQWAAAKPLT